MENSKIFLLKMGKFPKNSKWNFKWKIFLFKMGNKIFSQFPNQLYRKVSMSISVDSVF